MMVVGNVENKFGSFVLILVLLVSILLSVNLVITQSTFSSGSSGTFGSSTNSQFTQSSQSQFGQSGVNSFNSNNYRVFGSSVNSQFTQPGIFGFSGLSGGGLFNRNQCNFQDDFVMIIPPGGCSPAVVRSDLLEEQNVPVFCKVTGLNINPLIDVSRIRSVRFRGEYPKGISGVSYYPSKAALGRRSQFQKAPVDNDLGYLVVIVSRNAVESEMPDFVEGNVTAIIDYQSNGAFGIGDSDFYLSELSESEWQAEYRDFGFWNGRGYIRAESIGEEGTIISIYRDVDNVQSRVTLRKGETSRDVFLSGNICGGGMRIRLESVGAPVETALLQINDQQLWVAQGDRIINNRCRVTRVEGNIGGGRVSINCPVKDGKIDLRLGARGAVFDQGEYSIGDRVSSDNGINVYLAYTGQFKGESFSVLVKDSFSDSEREFGDLNLDNQIERLISGSDNFNDLENKIRSEIIGQYSRRLSSRETEISENDVGDKISIEIIKKGEGKFGVNLRGTDIIEDKDYGSLTLPEEQVLALDYYERAVSSYGDLVDFYPLERNQLVEDDPYAARGLFEAAELSKEFGMNARAKEFYEKLSTDYTESNFNIISKDNQNLLTRYDTKESKASVSIGNELFFIDLLNFRKPGKMDASATFLVNGDEIVLGLNEIEIVGTGSFKLTSMKDDRVTIRYDSRNDRDQNEILRINEETSLDGNRLKLVDINVNEQAKVRLLAGVSGVRSESNFQFKIGIEKRAIKLSPEKAKDLIKSLEESVESFSEINEKLGNVVRAMKGACFATSTLLTVNSFFDGLSGKSISRTFLMTNPEGWNEKCEDLVSKGQYSNINQCLLDKNDEINGDVGIYSNEIEKTNIKLQDIQDDYTVKGGLFGEDRVDSNKVDQAYKGVFDDFCKNNANEQITLPDKISSGIKVGDMCNWGNISLEQKRDVITLINTRKAGGSEILKESINNKLGKISLDAKNYEDYLNSQEIADQVVKDNNLGINVINPAGDPITLGEIKVKGSSDDSHDVYKNFKNGDSLIAVSITPVSDKDKKYVHLP